MEQIKTKLLGSQAQVKLIDNQTIKQVLQYHQRQIMPHLAMVAVGSAADSTFVKLKQQRAKSLGIIFSLYKLPTSTTSKEILAAIDFLNHDNSVHGIIVQLPLPDKLSVAVATQIINSVTPLKDIDALGQGRVSFKQCQRLNQLVQLADQQRRYLPTTAWSILWLLQSHRIRLNTVTKTGDGSSKKRRLLLIGKGRLVGQPLHIILRCLGIKHDWVDKNSNNIKQSIYTADVILTGTNTSQPFLDDGLVKEGAIICAAGNEINHIKLDNYVMAMTPKIGGVGPLTISLLLRNLVKACSWQTTK